MIKAFGKNGVREFATKEQARHYALGLTSGLDKGSLNREFEWSRHLSGGMCTIR